MVLHDEVAAPGRDLPRLQSLAAQPIGPVRREDAVGGARYGILVDPQSWREEARDEVHALARGRRNHACALQREELRHVGGEPRDLCLAGEHGEHATVVVGSFADGMKTPIFVIFKGKTFSERELRDVKGAAEKTLCVKSDSGGSDEVTMLEWFS